jgi:hypothetical protein
MKTMMKAQKGKIVKKKTNQGDQAPFTVKEQKERRKMLGLPTSRAEEKAYYAKMEKEGAKNGKTMKKSFPDLNKDGKVTKADILKGRGVIAKKGSTVKKTMKSGGKLTKCKYGCK